MKEFENYTEEDFKIKKEAILKDLRNAAFNLDMSFHTNDMQGIYLFSGEIVRLNRDLLDAS